MTTEKIKYSWADLNLKLTDCFDGVRGDMKELFSRVAILQKENDKLRESLERVIKDNIRLRKGVNNGDKE